MSIRFLLISSTIAAGVLFIEGCESRFDNMINTREPSIKYSENGQISYITPPRLSESDAIILNSGKSRYSRISDFFRRKSRPLPFIRQLESNAISPGITLCNSSVAFILPDIEYICIDITADEKIIFDFSYPFELDYPICVSVGLKEFSDSLLAFQKQYLEQNINLPLVFRMDRNISFDMYFGISQALRAISMRYMTLIIEPAEDFIAGVKSEIRCIEIPLACRSSNFERSSCLSTYKHSSQDTVNAEKDRTIKAAESRSLYIFLSSSDSTFYRTSGMVGPYMADKIKLQETVDYYFRNVYMLNCEIIVYPEIPFCQLIKITDMIKNVELAVINEFSDSVDFDRSEIDYIRRLIIRDPIEWDERTLSIAKENPELIEEDRGPFSIESSRLN